MTPAQRYRAIHREAIIDSNSPDHDVAVAEYRGLLRAEAEAAGLNWDAPVVNGVVGGGLGDVDLPK